MKDDFTKYEKMKASGATAEQVYYQAMRDGRDEITRIRLIRTVFSLGLREAKEVAVRAEAPAHSLNEMSSRKASQPR